MAGSVTGRRLVVGITSDLLVAGHDVLGAIDDPRRRDDAVERLITVAESGVAGLASFSVQRFQSFEATDVAEERAEASEDVLATALGQLTIAQTLLSAAAATEQQDNARLAPGGVVRAPEAESPSADTLRTALIAAGAVPAALEAQDSDLTPPGPVGVDDALKAALDALRDQVDETLDTVVTESAEAAKKPFTNLLGLAPEQVKQGIKTLGERVKLGTITNRLFRTALWALDQGLAALGRLIPLHLLQTARTQVEQLYERLGKESALDVVVAAVLGVPKVREYASQAFGRPGLLAARLALGSAELIALTARYKNVMRVLDGIGTAISLIAAALAIVKLVVPHLALLVAGAHALVAAAVILVGIDYVDVYPGPTLVRGVQSILRTAVE